MPDMCSIIEHGTSWTAVVEFEIRASVVRNIKMLASPMMHSRPWRASGEIVLRLFGFKMEVDTNAAVAPFVAMTEALAHFPLRLKLDVSHTEVEDKFLNRDARFICHGPEKCCEFRFRVVQFNLEHLSFLLILFNLNNDDHFNLRVPCQQRLIYPIFCV